MNIGSSSPIVCVYVCAHAHTCAHVYMQLGSKGGIEERAAEQSE